MSSFHLTLNEAWRKLFAKEAKSIFIMILGREGIVSLFLLEEVFGGETFIPYFCKKLMFLHFHI
jgi:hypothetical protein